MKKSYNNCVWGDYYAEYSLKSCNNPLIYTKKDKVDLDEFCKICEHFVNEKGPFEKCPFCKSTKVSLMSDLLWYVTCHNCKAQGPKDRDPTKAIESWNKRK